MKLIQMIGAGAVMVVGGGLLAWSLDDRSAQANIASADKMGAVEKTAAVQPSAAQPVAQQQDNVVTLPAQHTDMARSQEAARSTFDQFWTRISQDREGLDAISIKVAVPHATGSEHLWMTGCKSADVQSFDCVVSNKPVDVPLKLGSRYRFQRASISDWMYRQNGKIHGGYSIRVLLPTLPAQQAQAMTAMLAPLPE
jgi:uncharacterized protein YegJ (DUF2314 family)